MGLFWGVTLLGTALSAGVTWISLQVGGGPRGALLSSAVVAFGLVMMTVPAAIDGWQRDDKDKLVRMPTRSRAMLGGFGTIATLAQAWFAPWIFEHAPALF